MMSSPAVGAPTIHRVALQATTWHNLPPLEIERGEIEKARWQLLGKKTRLATAQCRAPKPGDLFTAEVWTVNELVAAKARLNDAKNTLDHFNLGCAVVLRA